jgi:hypothetical protein
MKYAVEMGLGAIMYIPSFIKIGSVFQNLIGVDSLKHRQHGYRISLLSFLASLATLGLLQNKESRFTHSWS